MTAKNTQQHTYYRDLLAETMGESVPVWTKKQKVSEDECKHQKIQVKTATSNFTKVTGVSFIGQSSELISV